MRTSMKTSVSPTFYFKAQKKYGGKYVAYKRNRILASGRDLKDLLRIMRLKKVPHSEQVVIGYIPSVHTSHVYINR